MTYSHRFVSFLFGFAVLTVPAAGQDPPKKRPWEVKLDPCADFSVFDQGGVVLDLGKDGGRNAFFRHPTTPSPFVALTLPNRPAYLVDLRNNKAIPTFPQPNKTTSAILSLSPDGEYVAFGQMAFGGGGDPQLAEAYSCKTGKLLTTVKPAQNVVLEWVDFGTPGTLLVSLRTPLPDNKLKRELEIRDLTKNGALIKTIAQPAFHRSNPPQAYAFTPGRKYVIVPAIGKKDFILRVFDLTTGEQAGHTAPTVPGGQLRELAVSADGKRLAVFCSDVNYTFHLYDLVTGECTASRVVAVSDLLFDFAAVYGHYTFGWLGDGKHVFIRSRNVWNVDTGMRVPTKEWGYIALTTPSGQIVQRSANGLTLLPTK